MNINLFAKTVLLYVIAAMILAIVPLTVSAKDTVRITNTSYSSVSTGNQSSKGEDGEDGADGEDGEDGADGRDGQDGQDGRAGVSITNTIGDDTATVHVQSSVNGETVVDIHEEVTSSIEADTPSETQTVVVENNATATAHATATAVTVIEDESSSTSTIERIKSAFASLQVIILSYVSFIF